LEEKEKENGEERKQHRFPPHEVNVPSPPKMRRKSKDIYICM
jgi:hypothetical protein